MKRIFRIGNYSVRKLLVLSLLLLFYLPVSWGDGVNRFTLLLFHVGFILMFEAWYLRYSSQRDKAEIKKVSGNRTIGFIRMSLVSLLGYRLFLFTANTILIIVCYRNLIETDVCYFILITYIMSAIFHVASIQLAWESRTQLLVQKVFFGFVGAFVLSAGALQHFYFSGVEDLIISKLRLINFVLLGALPVVAYASYKVFMVLTESTGRLSSQLTHEID